MDGKTSKSAEIGSAVGVIVAEEEDRIVIGIKNGSSTKRAVSVAQVDLLSEASVCDEVERAIVIQIGNG